MPEQCALALRHVQCASADEAIDALRHGVRCPVLGCDVRCYEESSLIKHLTTPVLQRYMSAKDTVKERELVAERVTPIVQEMQRVQAQSLSQEAAFKAQLEKAAASRPADTQWPQLAESVSTFENLKAFFARRQPVKAGAGPVLLINRAVMVANPLELSRYVNTNNFDIKPRDAYSKCGDTLLFHGCSQEAVANIQAAGLQLSFAAQGMLGKGLYGAPDPRKSLQYCKGGGQGRFMFLCRFNLAPPKPPPQRPAPTTAQHAGPSSAHRNSVFDEFCIFDEKHVVVLWMIKLA